MAFNKVLVAFLGILCVVSASLIVETQHGPIEGITSATHKLWLGVPFAAPPVGTLRWAPPTLPAAWTDVLPTKDYTPICYQFPANPAEVESEDCLYLNVWAPLNSSPISKLPVYVYIYGGAFMNGYTSRYEGSYLSGQDFIMVSMSYRTGTLGMFGHPILKEQNPLNSTGFYGMQDQRMAMEWVVANIAKFGGDPNRITLGGQSAGGSSVCLQLTMPKSFGLYQQAVITSGGCMAATTKETGYASAQRVFNNLGCNQGTKEEILACLYAANPRVITDQSATATVMPVLDDSEIEEIPTDLIYKGKFNPVPLFIGTALNESTSILGMCSPTTKFNSTDYVNRVTSSFPTKYEQVLETYPLSDYPTPVAAWHAIQSDVIFQCAMRDMVDNWIKVQPKVWAFSFEHYPVYPTIGDPQCYGASHSFEMYYLYPSFFQIKANNQGVYTAGELRLQNTMRNAWVNFIVNGYPVIPEIGANWPIFTLPKAEYVVLNVDNFYVESGYEYGYCDVVARPKTPAPLTCSAKFSQSFQSAWIENGKTYSQYTAKLENGNKPIYNVKFSISPTPKQVWGVVSEGSIVYSVPSYVYTNGRIPANDSSYTFGYIVEGSLPADLEFQSNYCQASAVNGACSVTVANEQVNAWGTSKQYVVKATNTGNKAAATVKFNLALPEGATMTSKWNMEQVGEGETGQYECSLWNVAPGQTRSDCGYIINAPNGGSSSVSAVEGVCA